MLQSVSLACALTLAASHSPTHEPLVVGFARAMVHTYDISGRIRKGPAPFNLEVPTYSFLEENKLLAG
jgi:hypothetical protein